MPTVTWTEIKNMSLAKATRQVGFDISVYEKYSLNTREEVKKEAIREVLKELSNAYFDETERPLKDVKKGVYVICLSSPFVIEYPKDDSEIIYIGQGNVMNRLKLHFEVSLFDFMQSLSGTDFDFYIAEPKMRGGGLASNYFKHVEYLLLNGFNEKFGVGKERDKCFPLLNKNAGSNQKLKDGTGWEKPLKKRAKKTPSWSLRLTSSDFKKL